MKMCEKYQVDAIQIVFIMKSDWIYGLKMNRIQGILGSDFKFIKWTVDCYS